MEYSQSDTLARQQNSTNKFSLTADDKKKKQKKKLVYSCIVIVFHPTVETEKKKNQLHHKMSSLFLILPAGHLVDFQLNCCPFFSCNVRMIFALL